MAISTGLLFAVVTGAYLFGPPVIDPLKGFATMAPKLVPAPFSQPSGKNSSSADPAVVPIAKFHREDVKALKGRMIYSAENGAIVGYVDEIKLDRSGRPVSIRVIDAGSKQQTNLPTEL